MSARRKLGARAQARVEQLPTSWRRAAIQVGPGLMADTMRLAAQQLEEALDDYDPASAEAIARGFGLLGASGGGL